MTFFASTGATEPRKIVVIGGGAGGVIVATHLLRAATAEQPVDVRIVENGPVLGPGLAYSTNHPLHTLNNYAGRLSAIDDDPDHLLRWCAAQGQQAGPTSFLSRQLYGRYLAGVLDDIDVQPGSSFVRYDGLATDVRDDPEPTVGLSDGRTLSADTVVLALGNPPPRRQVRYERFGEHYVSDPWAIDLAQEADGAREVLLAGTGLTMVDVAATLHAAHPEMRLTAVSRHALLPNAHKPGSSRLHDVFHPGTIELDRLLERIGARVREVEDEGGDWRDVIDSVRSCANDLWRGLSHADQDRFVAEVARRWEVARHRMAPAMATHIARMRASGALRIARGDDVDVTAYDRIINCTGPSPVSARGWNPLVDALLDRGTIRPHRLALGLDIDECGHAIDSRERVRHELFVVGAARRGAEWEVAAIPDLRRQSALLASLVLPASTETREISR